MTYIKRKWTQPDFSRDKQDVYRNLGLFFLRVGIASMMLFGHGFEKAVSFSDKAANFPDPLGIGSALSLGLVVFAELGCSLAIGFGFLTRLATIPLIITMLMAVFVIHGGDPWMKQEKAVLYLIPYFTLLFTGAGRYSVDWLWLNKKKDG